MPVWGKINAKKVTWALFVKIAILWDSFGKAGNEQLEYLYLIFHNSYGFSFLKVCKNQ